MARPTASAHARGVRLGLGLALLVAWGACSADRTMLVVRIESNLAIPDAMDRVRVVVTHAGKPLQSLPFSLASGAHTLPLQVGLLSPSGGGDDVEITVSGLLGSDVVVSQDAVTSFIKGKSLVLEMFLAAECASFDCHDPDKTCTQGQVCIDKTRTPATLPIFTAPLPPDAATDGGARRGQSDGGDALAAASGAGGGSGGAGGSGGGAGGGGGTTDAGMLDARVDGVAGRPMEAGVDLPGCVPKVEDCFNGMDDDCDGLNDCADPDCAPTTVCVPRPSGEVGTTVSPTQTCPVGFAKVAMGTPFGLTVQGGGTSCTGCQCGASLTTCTSSLTTFAAAADCQAAANGKVVATISSAGTDACPVPDTNTLYVHGASLSPWTVATSTCAASGTPVKPTASFATGTSFCAAANVNETGRTGCAAGSVCMRRAPVATGGSCVLLADTSACPAGTKQSMIVYAGIADGRACAACSCDLQGPSCNNLVLQMGSDYSCGVDSADLQGGARVCIASPTGVYTPGYHLSGAPTNGTCKPASAISGALAPSGGRALCCLQ